MAAASSCGRQGFARLTRAAAAEAALGRKAAAAPSPTNKKLLLELQGCKKLFKEIELLECKTLFEESNLVNQDYARRILQKLEGKRHLDASSPWFKAADVLQYTFDITWTVLPFGCVGYFFLKESVLSTKAHRLPRSTDNIEQVMSFGA